MKYGVPSAYSSAWPLAEARSMPAGLEEIFDRIVLGHETRPLGAPRQFLLLLEHLLEPDVGMDIDDSVRQEPG